MIYCVIPRELADELYDKMVDYYKDNPNVTVIIDRRGGPTAGAARPRATPASASSATAAAPARRERSRPPTSRPDGDGRRARVPQLHRRRVGRRRERRDL